MNGGIPLVGSGRRAFLAATASMMTVAAVPAALPPSLARAAATRSATVRPSRESMA